MRPVCLTFLHLIFVLPLWASRFLHARAACWWRSLTCSIWFIFLQGSFGPALGLIFTVGCTLLFPLPAQGEGDWLGLLSTLLRLRLGSSSRAIFSLSLTLGDNMQYYANDSRASGWAKMDRSKLLVLFALAVLSKIGLPSIMNSMHLNYGNFTDIWSIWCSADISTEKTWTWLTPLVGKLAASLNLIFVIVEDQAGTRFAKVRFELPEWSLESMLQIISNEYSLYIELRTCEYNFLLYCRAPCH